MRTHGISQIVDSPKNGVYRGEKPERIIGVSQVVIDCAGDTDDVYVEVIAHILTAAERSVAADCDNVFYAAFFKVGNGFAYTLDGFEVGATSGFQNRASALNYIGNGTGIQKLDIVVDKPLIAAVRTVDFYSVKKS